METWHNPHTRTMCWTLCQKVCQKPACLRYSQDSFLFGRNEPTLHHYHNTYRKVLGNPLSSRSESRPQEGAGLANLRWMCAMLIIARPEGTESCGKPTLRLRGGRLRDSPR